MPRSMWGDGEGPLAPLMGSYGRHGCVRLAMGRRTTSLLVHCGFSFRPVRLRLGGYTGHCRGRLADLDTLYGVPLPRVGTWRKADRHLFVHPPPTPEKSHSGTPCRAVFMWARLGISN